MKMPTVIRVSAIQTRWARRVAILAAMPVLLIWQALANLLLFALQVACGLLITIALYAFKRAGNLRGNAATLFFTAKEQWR